MLPKWPLDRQGSHSFQSGENKLAIPADSAYVGKIYEHDEPVATLTANTLAELRQQFSDWIAG